MRKWNKVNLVLLVLGLAIGLCACGNSGESASSSLPSSSVGVGEPNVSDFQGSDNAPQNEPDDTPQDLEPVIPEGLIIVDRDKNHPIAGQLMCSIYGLNPETGESRNISSFTYYDTRNIDGCTFEEMSFPLQCRWNFSSDYSKMALTKTFIDNQERHAGWIDTNGIFFDLTEELGLSSNGDFAVPTFYALQFLDGRFEFIQLTDDGNTIHYNAPLDDITLDAVQTTEPMRGLSLRSNEYPYNEYDVTSWIDDSHCIVNVEEYNNDIQSKILDIVTQTTSSYIPDNFQISWNGVISPDGSQIAFMAQPDGKLGQTDIYVIPVSGGDPVKISNHSLELCNAYYWDGSWGGTCTLIDWK